MGNEELLDVDQLCAYLKISKSTCYIWAFQNKLPKIKAGSRLLFSKKAIDKWLEARSVPAKIEGEKW